MEKQAVKNNLLKTRFRFSLLHLIGISLIAVGLFLAGPFIKPYIYYALIPAPLEASHSLKENDDRLFIPSIKLDALLSNDIALYDYGIIMPYGANLGEMGNTVLEGHNNAKNGSLLFSLLHLVKVKEKIVLHYKGERFEYIIDKRQIVEPKRRADFIKNTPDDRLTLITCYPPTSTAMRLILTGKLRKMTL